MIRKILFDHLEYGFFRSMVRLGNQVVCPFFIRYFKASLKKLCHYSCTSLSRPDKCRFKHLAKIRELTDMATGLGCPLLQEHSAGRLQHFWVQCYRSPG